MFELRHSVCVFNLPNYRLRGCSTLTSIPPSPRLGQLSARLRIVANFFRSTEPKWATHQTAVQLVMDSNILGEEALADDFGGMGLVGSHPGRAGGLRSRGRAGDRRIGGRDPRRTAHGNHGGDLEGLDMGQGFLAFNRPLPVRHMGGESHGGPQSTHGTGTQRGRGGSRGPMSHQEGPAIVENQVFGPPEPEQDGHGPIPKLLSKGAKDKESNLKKVVVDIPLPPTAGMRDVKHQKRAPQ